VLSRRREIARECVLVQLAVPSRERVHEYRELRRQVEGLVGQINGEFSEVGMTPVQYLHRQLPFEELVALYRAADIMLVTPLADGMNLVAKEYVATRFDDTGVLILSEFAGAARELQTALQVNPHDVDGLGETINLALTLPQREASRRMRRMRETVSQNTVYDWADSFITALSN
jgi:trehalose 6-phosphate synthase